MGGACVDGPVCAPLAGPQEAVGQDGQQRQDGHRQDHGERDGTCGEDSEVMSCLYCTTVES